MKPQTTIRSQTRIFQATSKCLDRVKHGFCDLRNIWECPLHERSHKNNHPSAFGLHHASKISYRTQMKKQQNICKTCAVVVLPIVDLTKCATSHY